MQHVVESHTRWGGRVVETAEEFELSTVKKIEEWREGRRLNRRRGGGRSESRRRSRLSAVERLSSLLKYCKEISL